MHKPRGQSWGEGGLWNVHFTTNKAYRVKLSTKEEGGGSKNSKKQSTWFVYDPYGQPRPYSGAAVRSQSHPRFANAHQLNVLLMDLANETGWKKRNQIDSHARSDEVGGRSIWSLHQWHKLRILRIKLNISHLNKKIKNTLFRPIASETCYFF